MKNLYICSLLFLLTACVTPYQDPRPLEEQKAALVSATEKLNGTYEILERRGDHWSRDNESGTIAFRGTEGKISIVILNPKRETYVPLQATDCRGFDSVDRNVLSIFCNPSKTSGINFFIFHKSRDGEIVKNGALIPSWGPMPVSSGEYVLHIGESGSGHPIYYRLKKKE